MKLSLSIATIFLCTIDYVYTYKAPAPAYRIHPEPHEYQNWLPSHTGQGHFWNKNHSVSPWQPQPCPPHHHPSHAHCSVDHPEPQSSFWLPKFHGAYEGTSPFLANGSNYTIFRNVKDFGAVGDGKADDTAAFNRAITCKPSTFRKSTTPVLTALQMVGVCQEDKVQEGRQGCQH